MAMTRARGLSQPDHSMVSPSPFNLAASCLSGLVSVSSALLPLFRTRAERGGVQITALNSIDNVTVDLAAMLHSMLTKCHALPGSLAFRMVSLTCTSQTRYCCMQVEQYLWLQRPAARDEEASSAGSVAENMPSAGNDSKQMPHCMEPCKAKPVAAELPPPCPYVAGGAPLVVAVCLLQLPMSSGTGSTLCGLWAAAVAECALPTNTGKGTRSILWLVTVDKRYRSTGVG